MVLPRLPPPWFRAQGGLCGAGPVAPTSVPAAAERSGRSSRGDGLAAGSRSFAGVSGFHGALAAGKLLPAHVPSRPSQEDISPKVTFFLGKIQGEKYNLKWAFL